MKKIITLSILLFISLFSGSLYSQSGWDWLNPLPVGVNLTSTYFINSQTGYSVGWNGVIIKTINGGINWAKQESNSNKFLTSVFFPSNNTGYISAYNDASALAQIIKTTNSGTNWNVTNYLGKYFNCLYFLNENTGYVGGSEGFSGVIYKTTDGAGSWTQQYNFYNYEIKSIFFVDSNNGFAAGRFNIFAKTTNGGNNWDTASIGGHFIYDFNSIFFINDSCGFLAGATGKIFRTTNRGINWVALNTNTTTDLYSIHFYDLNTGFAVGDHGLILHTTNSGNNWDSTLCSNSLSSISLRNSDTSYCVGGRGIVIKTTNAGASWETLSYLMPEIAARNLNSIFFTNHYGYIATDSIILKTSNNGNNWITLSSGSNYVFKTVYFLDDNTGFISGGYTIVTFPFGTQKMAKIYKTTNGGNNWILKFGLNQETNHYTQIFFTSSNVGWGAGNSYASNANLYTGGIIKTTNSGENWIGQSGIINTSFYSIFFTSSDSGYACGHKIVIKTTNSGTSWFNITPDSTMDYYSIYFNNASTGFITADNAVYKTTNYGLNWTKQILNSNNALDPYSMKFINNNTGYIVGTYLGGHGQVMKTTNGGNNWTSNFFPTLYGFYLFDLWIKNIDTVYVIGNHGLIMKSTSGGNTIGIISNNQNIPSDFHLYQNYPNPFNPITKISFDLSKDSKVKLIIYDILGREITRLLDNEFKRSGKYVVDFNGANLASGVYFYRIETGDFMNVKKMVLIK